MNLQQMQKPQPKQASPQQQEQFDLLLGRSRQLMAETGPAWAEALRRDPVRFAVKMGVQTVREIAKMSEEAGQPVDPVVLIHVGLTLVKDVAGLANDAGIVPDEQLETFIQQVTQQSIAEYMRLDADEGLLDKKDTKEPKLPGDPKTPDDEPAHEGAESPDFEQQEMDAEGEESEPQDEEEEMAMQLKAIRNQRKGM